MYRKAVIVITLVLVVAMGSSVVYANDAQTLAPNPDETVAIELPTTPPDWIDDIPITPEEHEEAQQTIAATEQSVARERAGIIMSSHRQTVGIPTEWVVAIGVGIATVITIVGIVGGRHGKQA